MQASNASTWERATQRDPGLKQTGKQNLTITVDKHQPRSPAAALCIPGLIACVAPSEPVRQHTLCARPHPAPYYAQCLGGTPTYVAFDFRRAHGDIACRNLAPDRPYHAPVCTYVRAHRLMRIWPPRGAIVLPGDFLASTRTGTWSPELSMLGNYHTLGHKGGPSGHPSPWPCLASRHPPPVTKSPGHTHL